MADQVPQSGPGATVASCILGCNLTTSSMKTLEEARNALNDTNVSKLKATRTDDPQPQSLRGLRSVAWKECLLFEDADRSKWPLRLSESRSAYNALRTHFLRAIEHPDELGTAVDPLADAEESPWDALRRDEALRAEIFQDVERCMPENVYFRQPSTQNMLLDILFIFCKLNPDVGYRQGMHELLAPIVWVVERDALDTSRWSRSDMRDLKGDKLLFDLLDRRYMEHDAFTLFGLLMQNAKSFYDPGSDQPKRASTKAPPGGDAPILLRIKRIYHRYLPEVDPELSSHLEELEVVPQLFLMKWIRLLFGREFAFDEMIEVWDALLASDPNLDLVDFVCIAMLLRIRWRLIEADVNSVLTLLLRYPQPEKDSPPKSLVQDALYLKQNLHPAGGAHIIKKRTKRRPAVVNHFSERPLTLTRSRASAVSPSPRHGRSPMSSPSRFPSGIGASSLGFEGLLGDAARAAYTRGERWGLNSAVRGAVGEVRKNMSAIGTSPRNSMHRRSSSVDLIRRCQRLEQRNKALADMLETALGELWECQKTWSDMVQNGEPDGGDGPPANGVNAIKSKASEGVDALGVAITKVQFVQVYLNDTTMPLPIEEPISENHRLPALQNSSDKEEQKSPTIDDEKASSIQAALGEAANEEEHQGNERHSPASQEEPQHHSEVLFDASHDLAISLTAHDVSATEHTAFMQEMPQRPPSASASSSQPRAISSNSNPIITTTLAKTSSPPTSGTSHQSRPSLDHSSYSWILGHTAVDRAHAFAAALSSPFGSEDHAAPGGRRTADKGKAFLFGEDEEDAQTEGRGSSNERGEGTGRGLGAGRGKRRAAVLRKKQSSSVKDAKKSEKNGDEGISLSAMSSAA